MIHHRLQNNMNKSFM